MSQQRLHFVSLGCPKNRVDAEHMLGLCMENGHELVHEPDDADVIVVNTCSFIGEAKEESIASILEMGAYREQGKKLVVSGCLAQRYAAELVDEMPEVDHFIGTSDIEKILDVVGHAEGTAQGEEGLVALGGQRNLVTHDLDYVARYDLPRVNSMPRHTAYLKVAEGCDNACAFCIIPKLRGKQRSRPIEDLVREARRLAESGVKELILIAQDLTGYGHDLDGRPNLAMLLAALSDVEEIQWVRCMYAYPRTLSGALLHQLDTGKNIVPYLDIPVQHGSDKMLRRMKRGKDQRRLGELLTQAQAAVRGLCMRSTVIVGFPGETDEDYQKLVSFADQVRFHRLGVFQYSDEEGTAAYDLDQKVEESVIKERYDDLMSRQHGIHQQHLQDMIGTVHEAIVEGKSDEHEYLVVGRLWSQAPEIDGITYLSSSEPLTAGDIVYVEITDAHDYDLVGEVLLDDDPRCKTAMPFGPRRTEPVRETGPAMEPQVKPATS